MNEQNTASSRITILPTYWDDTTDIQYMLGKDTVLKSVQMSGAGGWSLYYVMHSQNWRNSFWWACVFLRDLWSAIFAQKEVLWLKYGPRRTLPNGNR